MHTVSYQPPMLTIEYGPAFTMRNVARIPGDSGTYLSLKPLTGNNSPSNSSRVQVILPVKQGTFRLYYAPLVIHGQGLLKQPTTFSESQFLPDIPTDALYEFRSYRVTYRRPWKKTDGWSLEIGGTVKVRDATISLRQAGVSGADSNVGWVPLVHISGSKTLTARIGMEFDFDGLAGGPGRAFDIGARMQYSVSRDQALGVGVRTIEGGANVPRVFNFTWFLSPVMTFSQKL